MSARPGRLAAHGTGIAQELAVTGAIVLLGVAVAGLLARRRRVGSWPAVAGAAVAGAAVAAVMLLWTILGVATFTQFADVAGLAGALVVALAV